MILPELVVVEARETSATVHAEGVLAASADQEVRTAFSVSSVSFVIESYLVERGASVRRGDPIARLHSPHASVREAHERSMLHLLDAQLADARRGALKTGDASATLAVEAATARLEQSRANLAAARTIAEGVLVTSPIDGVVVDLPKPPAAGMPPGPIARIVCTDPLRLAVSVPFGDRMPERDAPIEIEIGLQRRTARVRGLAPIADVLGMPVLELDLPNPDARVPAGTRAHAVVEVGTRRALLVPESALLPAPGAATVWVAGPAAFTTRVVRVLSRSAGMAEVVGVAEGERVVRDAARFAPPSPIAAPPPTPSYGDDEN